MDSLILSSNFSNCSKQLSWECFVQFEQYEFNINGATSKILKLIFCQASDKTFSIAEFTKEVI
jgi:hypothetical protein